MKVSEIREGIFDQRLEFEEEGLLYDINAWKDNLSTDGMIRHHLDQFEQLCRWMIEQMDTVYDPNRWPDLDKSTFKSLIISVLTGKWVLLRQAIVQRGENSPYLDTLKELDAIADRDYQKLRLTLQELCKLTNLSKSSPLVYLGPLARVFLFDEQAPCLISTPLAAANKNNPDGQELCRQTIPHEVAHAIFEQIPGLDSELKFRIGSGLATGNISNRQKALHPVMLNWLEEVVADMTGTALGGADFAKGAIVTLTPPDKTLESTDDAHAIPLLRPYLHIKTLQKIPAYADEAAEVLKIIDTLTSTYMGRRFESLPAIISVTMGEVRAEMDRLVDLIWDTSLDALGGHSIGEVLSMAATLDVSTVLPRTMNEPAWGKPEKRGQLVFRLVGPNSPISPVPRARQYFDPFCCPARLGICCSSAV
jgi:hypothetical protein